MPISNFQLPIAESAKAHVSPIGNWQLEIANQDYRRILRPVSCFLLFRSVIQAHQHSPAGVHVVVGLLAAAAAELESGQRKDPLLCDRGDLSHHHVHLTAKDRKSVV